jgi:hypothetical protein
MVFGSFNLNSETPDLKWTFQGRNVTYTAGDNLKPNPVDSAVTWGQTFNNDGTKFYILQTGADDANVFTLSRPYDLTSVTSAVAFTPPGTHGWTGVSFSPDYKYYAGTVNTTTVYVYRCATKGVISASDTLLTSPALAISFAQSISWSGQNYIFTVDGNYLVSKLLFDETAGTLTYTGQQVDVSAVASSRGLIVNQAGTKMFICDTTASKSIYEYYLRVPYDLTTYVLAPTSIGVAALVTDEPATMSSTEISCNPEMTRIYVGDFSTSTANARVYQLRIK